MKSGNWPQLFWPLMRKASRPLPQAGVMAKIGGDGLTRNPVRLDGRRRVVGELDRSTGDRSELANTVVS